MSKAAIEAVSSDAWAEKATNWNDKVQICL